jgi:MerR family transcriptional regulator, light-induced transcriptional regulator
MLFSLLSVPGNPVLRCGREGDCRPGLDAKSDYPPKMRLSALKDAGSELPSAAGGTVTMKRELSLLDRQVFDRATSLFASKRELLPAEAVEAVAGDIVKRLAQLPQAAASIEVPAIDPEQIAAFCDILIDPDPEAALRFIEDRRAEGLSRQGVYLGYIPGGARCLGERWERDELSFLQVTSGTGHLYALMRALGGEHPLHQRKFDNRRVALFATVPGEDHGIGITVAAGIFRDAGWEIDLETGTDHNELVTHVERTLPKTIGLSLSTEQRLDALVRLVVAVRLIVPGAIIGVAPSSSVSEKRLHQLVDIDLVFTDAAAAFQKLEHLLRLQR